MISFFLNGQQKEYSGNEETSLLDYLRLSEGITSAKDGCSGQAACGACTVEINGKARLACTQKMKFLEGAQVITMEGIPDNVRYVIAKTFVNKGAVQCGFCTPGLILRTKVLFAEKPVLSRAEIAKAINQHMCRCTGYVKIIDAISEALGKLREGKPVAEIPQQGGIGEPMQKYKAYETAIGKRLFVNDMHFENMLYGALRFSDHPRAKILEINTSEALRVEGVVRIFTAKDIPGDRYTGLIISDWPLMIDLGETTRYIGDVLAGVVAVDEATARKAAAMIRVEYEVLEPVSDIHYALGPSSPTVHPGKPNLLEKCIVRRGEQIEKVFSQSDFVVSGIYETQRIEHAFLETETVIATPDNDGIHLFSQGQGIYVDQRQVASLLGIGEDKVRVTLVPCGGGFGGREDITVQGHVSLYSWLLKKPVKLHLTREESIMMHPKRHPVWMDITLACNNNGTLTGLKLRAIGDTGAYASVGAKVMERVAGHATGGYHVPSVDIESLTVYTNNIPSGAMRGFGVNQVTFALESCIDEFCKKGGFDRWKFRYDNALDTGKMTATGQVLGAGVGIRPCLLALKEQFYKARYAGIACGIKNSGVGNGMVDFSDVKISIRQNGTVIIEHGWTEMGQGVHNMAIQTLHQETGIDTQIIDVVVDTDAEIPTGMTTSSRATALLGNAIINAAVSIRNDLKNKSLSQLAGRTYTGNYHCDWTTKPGTNAEQVITHYSYGYAAQLVILDEQGNIEKVIAAHDAGKIMNPVLFEGQIQGAVHMGLGYALTEDLPMAESRLLSAKLRDCGVLTASQTPEIEVIGVEVPDPVGPYGAKGIGEIGLVPTAAAVANALCAFDGVRRYKLPMKREKK
ncbi:MAG TPA: selenium-dependent xanthine dehydrogenase [Bacteroidales bacterium]|nr:selenium-dependent xanthine dehydrogenase [Bacteroidales bacterium]